MYPVFDGHNDLLLRIYLAPENRDAIWLTGEGKGHLDLPRMKQGGFVGGFFAIYIPSPEEASSTVNEEDKDKTPFIRSLPDLIAASQAHPVALSQVGHMMWMERASKGAFKMVRSVAEIRECLANDVIAGIMHLEGAEPIDADLDALYAFHAMGLRSLGPVWSRPTVFGHGVPFAFPSGPDLGAGLTDAGKRLVRACNELRIMLDLSHLNEKGFDDIARLSDAPLVATHSNANVICPSSRNLTDRQLAVIAESRGMVGLNYGTFFLRRDGGSSPEMGWEDVMAHLDHLLEKLGEDHVGLGSDFDGVPLPKGIGDVTGLPRLQRAMLDHGYGPALVRKISCDNWLAVLDRTWGH